MEIHKNAEGASLPRSLRSYYWKEASLLLPALLFMIMVVPGLFDIAQSADAGETSFRGEGTRPEASGRADGSWTVLIYMAADNNLETYAIEDINEMESLTFPPEVSIVLQLDRNVGYDTSNGDWRGTRRYLVTHGVDAELIGSSMLMDMGEANMADPATLAEFLNWGIAGYPADNYMIILWDHGNGLVKGTRSGPQMTRGICLEESTSDMMSLTQMKEACERHDRIAFGRAFRYRRDRCLLMGADGGIEGPGRPRYLLCFLSG
jgi:hypothetical protein